MMPGSVSCQFHILSFVMIWLYAEGLNDHPTLPEGHLKKLGSVGPNVHVDTVDGFPSMKTFFDRYVYHSKPVKMTGAVQHSYPKLYWTDQYFLSLTIPQDSVISVYGEKKQSRKLPVADQHFHTFIQKYHSSDVNIDTKLPECLEKDIVLPTVLHCEEIYRDKIIDVNLQMSSGISKSMLYKQSAEKIICVYDGVKQFIMIDPHMYYDKVDLDLPISEASEVDVDRVDYVKYPGLAEVEFVVANISAGDCIFIPYKWFHQVTSYSRSVATAVWWEHQQVLASDISQCSGQYNPTLTANNIEFVYATNGQNVPNCRDFFRGLIKKGPINLEMFNNIMLNEMNLRKTEYWNDYKELISEVSSKLDKNGDGWISVAEVVRASEKDWLYVIDRVALLDEIVLRSEETRNIRPITSTKNEEL